MLDVASTAYDEFAVIDELSRAVQGRRTTAIRLAEALGRRARLTHSAFMADVLADVARGACSVLEHGYLDRVERRHGLAPARRQVHDRPAAGSVYRDVEYAGGLIVELDGRLFHDTTLQRDEDFDRDLEAAVAGKDSVRLSYRQVFRRACWTASKVGVLVQAHGWRGRPTRAGRGVRSDDVVG